MRLLTIASVIAQMNLMTTPVIQERVRQSIIMATSHLESYLKTSFEAGTQSDLFFVNPDDKSRQREIQRFHLSKAFVNGTVSVAKSSDPAVAAMAAGSDYLIHPQQGLALYLKGPMRGFIRFDYAYGFATMVDPAPEGMGDKIPANPADWPEALLAAAMMLSMSYFRMADECGTDGDCFLKSFCRAATFLEPFGRRGSNGHIPQ